MLEELEVTGSPMAIQIGSGFIILSSVKGIVVNVRTIHIYLLDGTSRTFDTAYPVSAEHELATALNAIVLNAGKPKPSDIPQPESRPLHKAGGWDE